MPSELRPDAGHHDYAPARQPAQRVVGCMIASTFFAAAAVLASSLPNVAAMKWERRILLVSAPGENEPALRQQRRIVTDWIVGAAERDLTFVEVVGDAVTGASDPADMLRQRYRLPADTFAAILIGKDGGVKLREAKPIPATTLEDTIDAMPMRRSERR